MQAIRRSRLPAWRASTCRLEAWFRLFYGDCGSVQVRVLEGRVTQPVPEGIQRTVHLRVPSFGLVELRSALVGPVDASTLCLPAPVPVTEE